jgi:hypothetical protein
MCFRKSSTAIDGLSGSARACVLSTGGSIGAARLYRRCRRTARIHPQPPHTHRFNNILQVLRTHILKGEIDLAADLTVCVVRDANAARLRNPFKASGDVDVVAKDIVVIDDDVTDVGCRCEIRSG